MRFGQATSIIIYVKGLSEKPFTWEEQSADINPVPPPRQCYPIRIGRLVGCHKSFELPFEQALQNELFRSKLIRSKCE